MNDKETVVFGGGCFWCTEAVFKMLKGVISVEPGYAGGHTKSPTYEQICNGDTGHAEVIKIEYDAQIIPLETLLTVFFATHDPTTKNRQGNDVGEQYRSIILCDNQQQIKTSEKFIKKLNSSDDLPATATPEALQVGKGAPITTQIKMLEIFYPAEDYHKNYYQKNLPARGLQAGKNQAYCQVVIDPKLKKVQEKFAKLLKENRN